MCYSSACIFQAELEDVQASFMKELEEVNLKLKTSENAVAELRHMRCNFITLIICFTIYLGQFVSCIHCSSLVICHVCLLC